MIDLIEIGSLVKQYRKQLGWSQNQLAIESGVSLPRIEALENHRISEIGFKKLKRIMNAVGLDLRITDLNQRRPTLEDLVEEEDQTK